MTQPGVEPQRIALSGGALRYTLRRSARRQRLALHVDERGVGVSAPLATPLMLIEQFIRGHEAWLQARLQELRTRQQAVAWVLQEGAMLPLFGAQCRVRLGTVRRAAWRGGEDGIEELHLPEAGASAALKRALCTRALQWMQGRVQEYCQCLGVPVPVVRLSSARTRWGSCSSRSGIRLHWRLVHLAPALIDYVVAHEVAHLQEMNHSPRFWAVVETLYPQWRPARAALRAAAAGLPVLHGHVQDQPLLEE